MPTEFMFELTKSEYEVILRSQNVTFEQGRYSKYLPFAFTELWIADAFEYAKERTSYNHEHPYHRCICQATKHAVLQHTNATRDI
ncbi:ORF6N domain-containing protein [Sphingobacterium tabacisoli]|uniref:ORF6N domain-containing protein n=1 Tax=Sphingobacterium tabacisoli TaxID=2044855 RepID=A0ABW5L2E7_9SPHI